MTIDTRRIGALLEDYSVEVTPAGAARIPDFTAILPAGTTVNVTFLPGSDIAETVAVCARLTAEGFNPVPHLAARSLESRDRLEGVLDELAARASVSEVLVIGGGVDRPVGPFDCSMQVLASGLLETYGIRRVGVAGHPEGSPDIRAPELARALAEKNAWARDTGMEVYIETQFCFDADAVAAWERRIRAAGNRLPIRVGIAGPATLRTLVRFAQISGIGAFDEIPDPAGALGGATAFGPGARQVRDHPGGPGRRGSGLAGIRTSLLSVWRPREDRRLGQRGGRRITPAACRRRLFRDRAGNAACRILIHSPAWGRLRA